MRKKEKILSTVLLRRRTARLFLSAKGMTLIEIMVVVAIIGALLAIVLPSVVSYTRRARATTCIANLRQINGSKMMWAAYTGASTGASCAIEDIVPAYLRREPECPVAPGSYDPGNVGTSPICPNVATEPDHVLS